MYFDLFIWLVVILAETNRSPFDLSEGESELVSGFNIEYRSGLFAFIFMSEYINILFIRIITALVFFSIIIENVIFSLFFFLFFIFIFRSYFV